MEPFLVMPDTTVEQIIAAMRDESGRINLDALVEACPFQLCDQAERSEPQCGMLAEQKG
jgi:hypothetical protein